MTRKSAFFATLSIGLGIAAAILVAELGMRLLKIDFAQPYWAVFDPDRGWAQKPDVSFLWREEGRAAVRFNKEGYRDIDHAQAKPQGVCRIAFLGDSMTVAYEVPEAETFARVAAQELASRPLADGRTTEVFNFGVRAYGTLQEWMTFRKHVRAYHPDLVIVAFFNNDLNDNSQIFSRSPDRPYLVLRDGGTTLEKDFRWNRYFLQQSSPGFVLKQWFKVHSRVLQALVRVETILLHPQWFVPAAGKQVSDAQAAQMAVRQEAAREAGPAPEQWEPQAWQVTERILSMFKEDVERDGARLVVFVVPDALQALPIAVRLPAWHPGPQRVQGTLVATGRRLGMRVLTYSRELQEDARRQGVCLYGFPPCPCRGHLNSAGHRLLGELLSRDIRAILASGRR